ncbi:MULTISPECIES: pseudouridine synthase [unclassified Lentimicrobium]|uniref:pseudouridine synthase n=1 Tax=unclassified Lentimicrobium TaxID=2677434 RepID=UPI001C131EC2|nr:MULTISPECIES: pseudouridine synthase [unclassified Lentimicrobium]
MKLEILYQDDYLVAINKPNGLLVHRTKIANDATEFALQILRNQLGRKVFPAHRIDRKTSGILLFSLDENTDSLMQQQFSEGKVDKRYLAIVRGFTPDEELIDYPLKKENGKLQEAITKYKTVDRSELEIPFSRHPTSRYSLLNVEPLSGRMHQIRKHLAHIHHPIIGDRPHGCNKQNKLFKEKWNMMSMMLHARSITFFHPITNKKTNIIAQPSEEFLRTTQFLGLKNDTFRDLSNL